MLRGAALVQGWRASHQERRATTWERKNQSHGERGKGFQAAPLNSHTDPSPEHSTSFSSEPNQSLGACSALLAGRGQDKRNSATARGEWNKLCVGQEGRGQGTGTRGECSCRDRGLIKEEGHPESQREGRGAWGVSGGQGTIVQFIRLVLGGG